MSTIIPPESLHYRSLAELQALYRKVRQELAASPEGSEARRAARISLENIGYAMARLRHTGPRF